MEHQPPSFRSVICHMFIIEVPCCQNPDGINPVPQYEIAGNQDQGINEINYPHMFLPFPTVKKKQNNVFKCAFK